MRQVEDFLLQKPLEKRRLKSLVSGGRMNGFFLIKDVLALFERLHHLYPQFVSRPFSIGSTVQGKDIPAFTLGLLSHEKAAAENSARSLEAAWRSLEDELSSPHQKNKSNVLFTALHHAREPLTLSMVVYVLLANLHLLLHTNWETVVRVADVFDEDPKGELISEKFFLFGNFVFVPAVNLDSYTYINEAFGTPSWSIARNKRKNMDLNTPCEPKKGEPNRELKREVLSGVDINRNYDIKFRQDDVGSVDDPCDETFRGSLTRSLRLFRARDAGDPEPDFYFALFVGHELPRVRKPVDHALQLRFRRRLLRHDELQTRDLVLAVRGHATQPRLPVGGERPGDHQLHGQRGGLGLDAGQEEHHRHESRAGQ